jgi:hypothetical protein
MASLIPGESPIPLKGEGFEDASLRLQRPGAACVSHIGRAYHDSNRNASAATEETRRHVGAPRCALSSRPLKGRVFPREQITGRRQGHAPHPCKAWHLSLPYGQPTAPNMKDGPQHIKGKP